MIGRTLLASVVGAVVLMAWGFVFWTMTPLGQNLIHTIDTEDAVIEVLDQNISESGVYFVPSTGMRDKSGQEAFVEKHRRGPLARISFRKEGADAQSPVVFIKGFVHSFLSVLLLVGIMIHALPRLASYRSRVVFVLLVGVFAGFFTHLSDPIWFHSPLQHSLYYMDFHILGWLFVGLALAPIIKPASAAK
ncbi:MAG: hypothetical protein OEN01_03360 [Candidatus Krumholzibacteria bacterium]|nr:hypothetical protein [Candidatus Krumholzibacteria bacterium]